MIQSIDIFAAVNATWCNIAESAVAVAAMSQSSPSHGAAPLQMIVASEAGGGQSTLTEVGVGLVMAAMLAAVHIFANRLSFLDVIPRSRWLSGAGGASVAYVFVHVLPELGEGQEHLVEGLGPALSFLEYHIYLVALFGFATFYGLERMAQLHQPRDREKSADHAASGQRSSDSAPLRSNDGPGTDLDPAPAGRSADVFWIHIGSFATYNVLIGYLLLDRQESGMIPLLLFGIAMALHFIVIDHGLREHHRHRYQRIGRWILTAGVITGFLVSLIYTAPRWAVALVFAIVAGGVILNVIKEELPKERESRFWAFAAGAVAYAVLLVVMAGA
ncbi:MAG: hypothetical protein ACOC0P_00330 [Planctomycetota bacterium]